MKMTPHEIMAEARRLNDERFGARNTMLKTRAAERFNRTSVDVPEAYNKTAFQHPSNIIDDEGRQIGTLVHAIPTPHQVPQRPEDQPLTTKVEHFLMSMHKELEDHSGPVWWQCTLAQVHDNIGWIYTAPKKVPYTGQPKPPGKDADYFTQSAYAEKNERFKTDAGISAVFDYEYVVTGTVLYEGNVYDPTCIYIWKEVPLSSLKKKYGVEKDRSGEIVQAGTGTGYVMNSSTRESTVTIVEYWDRETCQIVVGSGKLQRNEQGQASQGGYLLTEWDHNFGRVPYFARPAFVTEQIEEDKKFSGPLDGIYNEMPSHKRLRTMGDAISYNTAFSALQIVSKESGEQILDDSGNPILYYELQPGKAIQMAPGQEIRVIPQSPEVANFYAEMQASLQRLQNYTLSPVAKGISPGADTANAALSNLHRFQLSTLDPMAAQSGRQGRAIYRFWLERMRDMQETLYVLNKNTDAYMSLSAQEITSVNIEAKAVPDQGQQQLLIEKHAAELKQLGFITLQEMYSMWGKENPDEYEKELWAEKLKDQLMPVVMNQIITDLGMLDAVNAMVQANAQTGDARNAVPGLMQQVGERNGQGQGSAGQPRTPGVRMPTEDVNTQEAQALG